MSKIWITRADLRLMLKEATEICEGCGKKIETCECDLNEEVNPWAVCTSSTGQKSGKKRERCIKKVKKQQRQS